MQMHNLDIIHILLVAVACVSHIADHISRCDVVPLLESFGVRSVLAQVCIVVIPLLVKAADADAPSAVAIPTKRLHVAGLDCDDWRAD